MQTQEKRLSPVDRQLEAYRESWHKDHEAAMQCRDWEEVIAVGVSTGRLLQMREEAWRERVFRGTLEYDPADDHTLREQFTLWLDVTDMVLARFVPRLEREFGLVEGARELRDCASTGRSVLAKWEPARLSAAVGLREMTLTAESAEELDRLLEESRRKPAERLPTPAMAVLSAEEFRALKPKPS